MHALTIRIMQHINHALHVCSNQRMKQSTVNMNTLVNNLDVAGQRKTIVRKAAQFITQPLFLFFTKAFSPLTLQVKYGGIKKERKKVSTAIYVESMARKHPR